MAKIKTGELIDLALNWAVAYAQGRTPTLNMCSHGMVWHGWWLATGGVYERMPNYSNDWAQAGPIIAREQISVDFDADPECGGPCAASTRDSHCYWVGPTPLIAAMRCYVALKLGNEVDVPDALTCSPTPKND